MGKSLKFFLFFFIILYLISDSPLFGARPLVTDDYGTVTQGKFELETGLSAIFQKSENSTNYGLGIQLKYGVFENFDFGIEAPFSLSNPKGLEDLVLHGKLKFLEIAEDEGFTGKLDVKLATASVDSGLGSGFTDYTLTLVYSKPLGDFKTHYNLGYSIIGSNAEEESLNTFNYGIALEKGFSENTEGVLEFYGSSSKKETQNNLQFGGRWFVSEWLRFDAGYSFALNESSNNIFTAGLTGNF